MRSGRSGGDSNAIATHEPDSRPRPRWGDISYHRTARAHNAVLTDMDTWNDRAASSQFHSVAYDNAARQMGAGADVRKVANYAVVVDGRSRVDDDVFSLNRCFDAAISAGRLFGMALDGRWAHVGDMKGLALANKMVAGE